MSASIWSFPHLVTSDMVVYSLYVVYRSAPEHSASGKHYVQARTWPLGSELSQLDYK